jgi:hypothetical protein
VYPGLLGHGSGGLQRVSDPVGHHLVVNDGAGSGAPGAEAVKGVVLRVDSETVVVMAEWTRIDPKRPALAFGPGGCVGLDIAGEFYPALDLFK